jgi:hypothetical protein
MKKVAIIGIGKWGKKLITKFNSLSNVIYCCDNGGNNNLSWLKESYPLIKPLTNCNEVLEDNDVDIVIIATPTITHYDLVKKALNYNKNVFVEKPLSDSLEKSKELIEMSIKSKLNLFIDNVFLYRNEFIKLKEQIKKNNIIKIIFNWEKYGTFKDSILNNLVYHDMYLLLDLFNLQNNNMKDIKIVECSKPIEKSRIDILKFKFNYNNVLIEGNYNRISEFKKKSIKIFLENGEIIEWVDDKSLLDNNLIELKKNDALLDMISNFLNNNVDYNKNHFLALTTSTFLQNIRQSLDCN